MFDILQALQRLALELVRIWTILNNYIIYCFYICNKVKKPQLFDKETHIFNFYVNKDKRKADDLLENYLMVSGIPSFDVFSFLSHPILISLHYIFVECQFICLLFHFMIINQTGDLGIFLFFYSSFSSTYSLDLDESQQRVRLMSVCPFSR